MYEATRTRVACASVPSWVSLLFYTKAQHAGNCMKPLVIVVEIAPLPSFLFVVGPAKTPIVSSTIILSNGHRRPPSRLKRPPHHSFEPTHKTTKKVQVKKISCLLCKHIGQARRKQQNARTDSVRINCGVKHANVGRGASTEKQF